MTMIKCWEQEKVYENVLRKALDITLIPYKKIPRFYREARFKGLYLLCSQEEHAEKPFFKATGPSWGFDGIQLQGDELTLDEAAEYLREQNANPDKVRRKIRRAKNRLERKAKVLS